MHECDNNQVQIDNVPVAGKSFCLIFYAPIVHMSYYFFAVKKGIQYKSFKSSIGPRHSISEIVTDLSCSAAAADLKRLETRAIKNCMFLLMKRVRVHILSSVKWLIDGCSV